MDVRDIEQLAHTKDPAKLALLAELLDDPDRQIRGEAFGALVLNRNEIGPALEGILGDGRRNVRAFACLVLANRGERRHAGAVEALASDRDELVRASALAALGHLGGACGAIVRGLGDARRDVRRAALEAAARSGCPIPADAARRLAAEGDAGIDEALKACDPNL